MLMPKGLQVRKLKDEIRKAGVSPDLIDVEALVDGRLTYPENARKVLKLVKNTSNKATKSRKGTKTGKHSGVVLSFEKAQAQDYHSRRSPHAQATDNAKQTKLRRTITDKTIVKNPMMLNRWYKDPNEWDIIGVDGFGKAILKRKTKKRKVKPKSNVIEIKKGKKIKRKVKHSKK